MTMKGRCGFTALEIVMVLAIIGLMAGALTPVAFHVIESEKEMAAREELKVLKKAIIGDPQSTKWGSEATFGYIGDIGSLPENLEDLYTQPVGVPTFSFDSILGIGYGWRGPYTAKKSYASIAEFLKDPYGQGYTYSSTITTDPTLGAEVRGIIRSLGWNGADDGGTQDDLTIEILKPEVLTDVAGKVKNAEGMGVPTVSVTINYPDAGALASSTSQTDIEGRYQFSDIPLGQRAITLEPGLVYIPGTAYAGVDAVTSLQEVEFSVANLSSSNITITSIMATYITNPFYYYGRVIIDGVRKDTLSQRAGSGTTVGLTPVTADASTMQVEPFCVLLQSSRLEIPDIELSTIGAGDILKIELQDFADAVTGGAAVSMTGIAFMVDFSNGSKVIFTPQRR